MLPIILTLGLLITGCSSQATEGDEEDMLAPDFQLQDLNGQTISLSDFRGETVLLNFWNTGCIPCRDEMPYLQQVYDEMQEKGLVMLAINIGDSSSTVKDFMDFHHLSLPVLLDTKGVVMQRYNVQYIPTTFLIDKDGVFQAAKVGAFSSKEEIEAGILQVIP